MTKLAFFLVLSLSVLSCLAGNAVHINLSSFDREVVQQPLPVIIFFYTPWCQVCRELFTAWEEFATKMVGFAVVGDMDSECPENKAFARDLGALTFPTFKYYDHMLSFDKYQKNKPYKPSIYVNVPMNVQAWTQFMFRQMPNYAQRIAESPNLDKALEIQTHPTALFFVKPGPTKPVVKLASILYLNRAQTIEVVEGTAAAESYAARFGVTSYPSLILFKPNPLTPVMFQDEPKRENIIKFIDSYALPPPPVATPPPVYFYTNITDKNFERKIRGDVNKAWLLLVLNGGGHEYVINKFNDVGLACLGYADFGVIRMDEAGSENTVKALNVSVVEGGRQTIFVDRGKSKRPVSGIVKSTPYSGTITEEEVWKYLQYKLPAHVEAISRLTTSQDLQLFFQDPNKIEMPKIISFTKSAETSPQLKALALEHHGGAMFAEVPHDAKEIIDTLKPKAIPSMLMMILQDSGKTDANGQKKLDLASIPYQGNNKYHDVREWIRSHMTMSPEETANKALDLGKDLVEPINSPASFENHCLSKSLCIIFAFGPDELDDEGKPQVMEMLNSVAAKNTGRPLNFVWMNAEKQHKIADALNLGARPLPAAVAVNPRKKMLAHFIGAYDLDSLAEFGQNVLSGSIRVGRLVGHLVAIDETIKPEGQPQEEAKQEQAKQEEGKQEHAAGASVPPDASQSSNQRTDRPGKDDL